MTGSVEGREVQEEQEKEEMAMTPRRERDRLSWQAAR